MRIPILAKAGRILTLTTLATGLWLTVSLCKADQTKLTLVSDGAPAATIIVPKSPGPAWFAAGELQYHVKKITGATLPVVKDGEPVTGLRVIVGMSEAKELTGLVAKPFAIQEYAIQVVDGALILAGRDPAPDASKANQPLKLDTLPEYYTQMGSAYAVYDFLEQSCGVRWYAPTEDGMVCPKTKNLTVRVQNLRRTPALQLRQNPGSGQPGTWGMVAREPQGDEQKLLMLRLKMGGRNLLIGHTFEGFPERFWEKSGQNPSVFEEKHPEYFALKADGSREVGQMCFSSTGLVAQVVKDARHYFDTGELKYRSSGGEDYFCIGPRDMESNICQCDNCKAHYSKENWPFFSSGRCSETVWWFVNGVTTEIKKTHPDKHIACFAYFDYAFYPKTVALETENIYSGPCLHTANWWAPAMEKNDLTFYRDWVKNLPRGHNTCVWMYQCFPWENGQTMGFKVFPSWHGHTISKQMKMFAKDGVRGVFVCGGVTPYIDGYITVKMMDHPELNVDQILNEFFTGYYGGAAEPMKQLYLGIESAFMTPANYPDDIKNGKTAQHQSEELAWKYVGTTKRMNKFGKLLAEAKAKADSDSAKMHVAVFEKDIWSHMVSGKARWDIKTKYGAEVEQLKKSEPPALGVIPAVPNLNANGELSKVDWSKALVAKVTRGTDGYPLADPDITLRMLHDGTNLYIQINERVDFSIIQNAGYFGDRWEVYFANQRALPYRQIGLMPDGELRDHAFGQDATWHSGFKRSDGKENGYWTINLAVPIANLSKLPLKAGDKLFMNFVRATSKGVEPKSFSALFQAGFHCLPRLSEATLEAMPL